MLKNNQDIQVMRVAVFEEEGMYVARCLEKNIGAQAKDLDELFNRLYLTIFLNAARMDKIPKSPARYFEMWERPDLVSVPVAMPLDARMVAA